MLILPNSSIINRFIAKNSFDKHTTSKQQKLFSDIDKITWANKLSTQTINLEGKEIEEIQIFEILLRHKASTEEVLNIIDRYIPYHIIFVLKFEEETMYSAAQKHPSPSAENTSVIDWRFSSDWKKEDARKFQINLKSSLDDIFSDFCFQISGRISEEKTLAQLIQLEQKIKNLTSEIGKLESEMKNCKQFNIKVKLNQELNKLLFELGELKEKQL